MELKDGILEDWENVLLLTNSDKIRSIAVIFGIVGSILGSTALLLSIFEGKESKEIKKVGKKS